MDLDNINDIEVLRNAAKKSRTKIKEDIVGGYTFKKGYWYLVDQDEFYVTIYSDDYKHRRSFTYKEAGKYLTCD